MMMRLLTPSTLPVAICLNPCDIWYELTHAPPLTQVGDAADDVHEAQGGDDGKHVEAGDEEPDERPRHRAHQHALQDRDDRRNARKVHHGERAHHARERDGGPDGQVDAAREDDHHHAHRQDPEDGRVGEQVTGCSRR